VVLHDLRFAGEAANIKLDKIRAEVGHLRADALVISDPQRVAWTFNIRGSDVAHTPLPLAFAIVPKEGRTTLYIDSAKLSHAVRHKLEENRRGARARCLHRRSQNAQAPRNAIVRLDQATGAECAVAPHRRRRRQGDAWARPDRDAEGGQEPGRDRGRAGRACA